MPALLTSRTLRTLRIAMKVCRLEFALNVVTHVSFCHCYVRVSCLVDSEYSNSLLSIVNLLTIIVGDRLKFFDGSRNEICSF